ncbi:MAG: hydrogenase iron-sulfur subunit [Deltaproteobacteria bacterium]|nr:MAG: hydrogenase iron-sulfur subunit [Deltaproteobacteria bacterium]
MEKLGVFFCTGCNIGKAVDIEKLKEVAGENGAAVVTTHHNLCDAEGRKLVEQAIATGEVGAVLIAACSEREKRAEFRLDRTKIAFERLGLREQVAWSQPHGEEDTQMLAEDLVRMWLARLSKETLAKPLEEQIDMTVLVVGGGLAGLTAARAVSELGHPTILVEKSDRLGGMLSDVEFLPPEAPPWNELHENPVPSLVATVEGDGNIEVITGCRIRKITGQPGQFDVELEVGGEVLKRRAGAIVQATGAHPYPGDKLGHLGYGACPDVVTADEFEKMLGQKGPKRPSDGSPAREIVFVQCAGSRDPDHLPYCSSECCLTTLKQVAQLSRSAPEVRCRVIYRDMRAPGQFEHFYRAVQETSRAAFTKGDVEKIEPAGSRILVRYADRLIGQSMQLEADLVVLANGMVPNSADGEAIRAVIDARARIEKHESDKQVEDAQKIVDELGHHEGTEILNLEYRQGPDLPVLRYGFPDSHYICFPYETRRTGIYTAGAVHAPMDWSQAVEDGWGAAMKAVQSIRLAEQGKAVHPRAGDISVADFFLQRCTQCKRCTEECPFGTLNEDEKGTPRYNPLRCRRCGICLGACPERIISFPEYSVDAVASMVKAVEVPEEDEEKPRVIAFMCENDALPALEEAAARGLKWNPWVRIIPVRCLGAVNTVWIADSLSRGIDGVLLIGCPSGDDYQCHYIRGSELAKTRMSNVQETLERLTLESERVQVHECSRHEWRRVVEIIEQFKETIDEVGANPYKGF